jgi:hypothetical protein
VGGRAVRQFLKGRMCERPRLWLTGETGRRHIEKKGGQNFLIGVCGTIDISLKTVVKVFRRSLPFPSF